MLGKVEHLIISIFIILMLLFQLAPCNVSAIGPTLEVVAQFNEGEEEKYVDVSPGEHGRVLFHGTVTAEVVGGTVQEIIVSLQATSEMGWIPTLDPPQMTLQSGETKPFKLVVTVPSESSCYLVDTVTIAGKGVVNPGTAQDTAGPIHAYIRVNQFGRFNLSSPNPNLILSPNSKKRAEIQILNQGNCNDVYNIEILNLNELDCKSFHVSLSTNRLEVNEKSRARFFVFVRASTNARCLGVHEINIKVTSEQNFTNPLKPVYFDLAIQVSEHYFIYTTEFYILLVILLAVLAGYIIWYRKRIKKLSTTM